LSLQALSAFAFGQGLPLRAIHLDRWREAAL
jgi:hypothetical protein